MVDSGSGVRVLIVDDEPDLRFVLRHTIAREPGWTVCGEAADGDQAVERARDLRPDVVVLDLVMPVRRGDEVLPVLTSELPDAMIVVHCSTASDADRDRLLGLGAFACYDKGWVHDLARQLAEDLQRFRAAGSGAQR